MAVKRIEVGDIIRYGKENKPHLITDVQVMSKEEWDKIHASRRWGVYPQLELVRWVHRYWPEMYGTFTALDIGCARGANLRMLEEHGFLALGIDSSSAAVENLSGASVMDARHLTFTDQAFDCIIDICCIQHNTWEDAQQILRECWRVLKPGGRMFSMMAATDHDSPAFMLPRTSGSVRNLMEWEGFKIIDLGRTTTKTYGKPVKHWLIDAQRPA